MRDIFLLLLATCSLRHPAFKYELELDVAAAGIALSLLPVLVTAALRERLAATCTCCRCRPAQGPALRVNSMVSKTKGDSVYKRRRQEDAGWEFRQNLKQ